ncbi:MAG: lipoyl synthase, partial [Bacteroidales bacterium]|nr:lipoyl synthase [Bacteroidales bacterium]
KTIEQIRLLNPKTSLETLIPDFNFDKSALNKIIAVRPEIVSHNLETVRRLTPKIRSRAKYDRSLAVLKYLQENGITTKSGIMLGMGETTEEIDQVMDDLLAINCKIITIGQYLQPTSENLPVEKFISEKEFNRHRAVALSKGFDFVESGSLVRSSYHAEKHVGKEDFLQVK